MHWQHNPLWQEAHGTVSLDRTKLCLLLSITAARVSLKNIIFLFFFFPSNKTFPQAQIKNNNLQCSLIVRRTLSWSFITEMGLYHKSEEPRLHCTVKHSWAESEKGKSPLKTAYVESAPFSQQAPDLLNMQSILTVLLHIQQLASMRLR